MSNEAMKIKVVPDPEAYTHCFVTDDDCGWRGAQLHEVREDGTAVVSWVIPTPDRGEVPWGATTAQYRAAQEVRHEVSVWLVNVSLERAKAAARARKVEWLAERA